MGRQHNNPLHNPLHYAAAQTRTGPPVTAGAANRALPTYDYGKSLRPRSMNRPNLEAS